MTYQIAAGHDNAAGLADISIQPNQPGLVNGRERIAGDQVVYVDGTKSTSLNYGYLTKAQYAALLTEFGLTSVSSAYVTISLPDNEDYDTFSNYNATIKKPNPPSEGRFIYGKWVGVQFRLIGLEAI